MRGSYKIAATRAATHTTPGAIVLKTFCSAPTPSGTSVTTTAKKKIV